MQLTYLNIRHKEETKFVLHLGGKVLVVERLKGWPLEEGSRSCPILDVS